MDNLTPEEKQVRLKKADSIRRMLAEQSSVQSGHRNSGNAYNTGCPRSFFEKEMALTQKLCIYSLVKHILALPN